MIKLEKVSKYYDNRKVLDDLSFPIKTNSITGIIGPNGVGKTTTMKIITKLIKKYEGDVNIDDDPNRRLFGILMENPKFYVSWTGMKNLVYFEKLFKLNSSNSHLNDLIKFFGMESYIDKKVKDYSLGMKQKLGLCIALLGYPQYLVIDEPTNGLDPSATRQIIDELKKLNKNNNITIFISSHNLGQLDTLCEEVIFVNNGKIKKIINMDNIETDTKIQYKIKYLVNNFEKEETIDMDRLNDLIKSNIKIIRLVPLENVLEKIYIEGVDHGKY